MSMKRMKRLLVLCLALVMVVGLLSVTALADGSMQVTFSQKGGAYYFPGDELTVTVTGLPSGYNSTNVTLSHNGGDVLEAVGSADCGEKTYAQTYRVARIEKAWISVQFTATYPDMATASGTIAMNLRNQLTVTLPDAGQPLSGAEVVLHHAWGGSDITLQAQGSGTYVTGRTALSNGGYDYVSVTTADGRTATITETTSGGSLMNAIRAGTDLVEASYAFDGCTVAGTLYVNGTGVSNWSTRYAGPYGETIDFGPMVKAAEEKALSVDAANAPARAVATVYYPGSDNQPAAGSTYGGDGFNWQLINGKYITYFWVKATTYYNVSFDTNGGSNVDTQEVVWNGTAIKPEDPTRSGYKFLGWYTEDDKAFDFATPIASSVTLYAKWEKDATPAPDLHYYVDASFPSRLLTGTYRDVSLSIWGDRGVTQQKGATLYVAVDGPAYSDADLWYYEGDGWYWGYGKYVDTVREGKIPDTLDFNETGITIPLSLYLDKAGTYKFTFTLKDADGKVLATDTATVKAYNEAHGDYRIYLDCGKHGSISTTPSTWADYKDTVTITVTPAKGYELDTLRVYDSDKDRVSVYTNYHGDYTFTMPKSSVTVYATFKEVNYDHFVDVSRDSWYYDAVYYVYDHGIMDGVGNRKFAPYSDLSRAMIVTTLYRLEDEPRVRTYGTFRDVDEDAWYADAVEWAAEEGIVKGYGKKTFGPNNSVTVEQLAAILQRYADYKGYDIDEAVRLYSDAVVSAWAVDNVRWAVAEDLLRGGRSVNATKVATRAEIAYALYNFMMNVAD